MTLFIEPGSPWENRSGPSDWSGKSSIRCWRPMVLFVSGRTYNTIRPRRALGYRPTALEAGQPGAVGGANTTVTGCGHTACSTVRCDRE